LGAFHICQDVAPPHDFSTCGGEWNQIAETDVQDIFMFGRGETCIETEVLSPTGRQSLGPQFLNDFDPFANHVRPVSQITNREALAVAVDLIKSAEKISDLAADSNVGANSNCHIGGPIKAMLLDEIHPMPFRLQ
jgi:hypothetical protein